MWDGVGGPNPGLASALRGGEDSFTSSRSLLANPSNSHKPGHGNWHKWLLGMKGSVQGTK